MTICQRISDDKLVHKWLSPSVPQSDTTDTFDTSLATKSKPFLERANIVEKGPDYRLSVTNDSVEIETKECLTLDRKELLDRNHWFSHCMWAAKRFRVGLRLMLWPDFYDMNRVVIWRRSLAQTICRINLINHNNDRKIAYERQVRSNHNLSW